MATIETAKSIFDSTSGKLYFMLKSIFDSEDTVQGIMMQTYAEVFAANENPTEADVFIKSATICFGALGKPDGNNTDFPIENMRAFFDSCEKFSTPVSNEAIAALDVLNNIVSTLDPLSKLLVFLRMYVGMSFGEIASVADTAEESIIVSVFSAYRTIMPPAAQICAGIPLLQGQPVLPFIRIALLKQAFNTVVPANIGETLFAPPAPAPVEAPAPVAVSEPIEAPAPIAEPEPMAVPEPIEAPAPVIIPEPVAEPIPVIEAEPAPIEEPAPITEPEPMAEAEPVMENISSGFSPTLDFDSPEWSYIKNKFGFDFSDDINAKLSEAYSLIAKGHIDTAKEILFSINREAPNAASLLGLLMIDVGAVTPDDMFNIPADYANLPTFKGADYYANSQLKDFLGKLLAANAPAVQPAPPTPPAQPMPHTEPQQPKEKKGNTGLIIAIVIMLAIIAIAGVLVLTGVIDIPGINKNKEETSETAEATTLEELTNAEEEPTTAVPTVPKLKVGTTTVSFDRSADNRFEFTPEQSGYYTFTASDDTIDLDATLFSGTNLIAADPDSGSGQNFMITVYCDANNPFTLSIKEKTKGSGQTTVSVTVTPQNNSEGKAYAKYTDYTTRGITLTDSDTLYSDHSLDALYSIIVAEGATISPTDFYIDKSEGILWLAFPVDIDNQVQTYWYPVSY